jgi:SAM-dependent methyltransferase
MATYTGTENLEVMAEAKNYNRFLLDLIRADARKDKQILDFGAGVGTFACPLVAEGFQVSCVEPDDAQALIISQQGIPVTTSLSAVPDSSVDFIYTFNVLEHIAEDLATLTELRPKLRSGGTLLVYVPAFSILFTSMDRRVGHIRRYGMDELCEKVTRAGLRVTAREYVDSLGFLATLLYKWTDDNSGRVNRRALKLYDAVGFPLSRLGDILFKRSFGKNILVRATTLS